MRKFILFIFAFIAAYALNTQVSYGNSSTDHDCIKCHKLTTSEAQAILQGGIPGSKALEVNPGPVKGLWEVVFEMRGQKEIIYIGYSKELVFSGEIFNTKLRANLTAEKHSQLNKIDISKIPLADALVMGDKNAKHKVIVLDDPD